MVKELEPGSPSLRDLNERFTQFAKDIDILSCYETEATKTVVMSVRNTSTSKLYDNPNRLGRKMGLGNVRALRY